MSYLPPSMRRGVGGRSQTAATVVRTVAIPIKPLVENEIARREGICAACEWNTDWTCQHLACKVCPGKQKLYGERPLKRLLRMDWFTCPVNKFDKKPGADV